MSRINLDEYYLEQLKKIVESYEGLKLNGKDWVTPRLSANPKQVRKDNVVSAPSRPINNQKPEEFTKLITQILATVERITGSDSPYTMQVKEYLARSTRSPIDNPSLSSMIGVIQALIFDLENGYLKSASELIHGDVFTDYLSMAEHLLEEGYKDAAAVLAGGTLEAHLKQLCAKHSIDTDFTDNKGNIRNKKADAINSELAKANAYTKQDQKNVTAWLNLRNNAAHTNYHLYTDQEVRLLIASIRDFIVRVPA